jgi:hypothetical protein
MKLLNKLNGWQRLWLVGTVAGQLFIVLSSRWLFWPTWDSCLKRELPEGKSPYLSGMECVEYQPRQEVFIDDIEQNLKVLFLCLVFYAAVNLSVILVR